ncbi:MAG: putative Ig domain protein [Pelotomaculum sp. PtaB.Bin013]|uniref:Ig domain-containing protein n=1 Tax=Pelotomaculum isophthalicicum JI TaxID=947010 RepID=A0A9X4H054_9FIRM|nr:putative Ig domain-containing protein [Pelotomaculum isophthalicicum]MDF9409532.1 putative Ig domain-containing protein [Pelotomaculum isophthalicicum JI]OPX85768.1 MAG: putative Ig domain protein [Pelotomaculum sp. PtaB.Bin013]
MLKSKKWRVGAILLAAVILTGAFSSASFASSNNPKAVVSNMNQGFFVYNTDFSAADNDFCQSFTSQSFTSGDKQHRFLSKFGFFKNKGQIRKGNFNNYKVKVNGHGLDLVAQALGMTTDQLKSDLQANKKFSDIVAAQGMTMDQFKENIKELIAGQTPTTPGQTALSITTAALANGQVNSAYNTGISATGGTSPYSFSLTSGSLPAGLSLASNGTISGTPTTAGTWNFTITVTDNASVSVSQAYSLTIDQTALNITTTALANGLVNSEYNAGIGVTGGTSPYSFSLTSGGLPTGLSLASNGTISGTPTTAGTWNFTITVTDNASVSVSQAFSLTIQA